MPADLHVLLSTAKNLPELSIRIFNPLASYFLINRYVFRIADPDTLCCRIAYPTEHYSCGLQATIYTNKTNVPADL